MGNYASKVLEIALAEVGYLEKKNNSNLDSKTGNAGSNNYTKYARDLDAIPGFYNGKKNGYAWCDVFVDWCFVKAFGVEEGMALLCQPSRSAGAGCLYSRNYYKNKGQFYSSNPKPGDQIFFYNSSKSDISHTGIVYAVDNTYVYTVEGNTSGASGVVANGGGVRKKKYALNYSRLAGYGRPKYDVEEPTNGSENESKPEVKQEPEKKPESAKGGNTVNIELNVLRRGNQGEQVKTLQRILMAKGFKLPKYGADGDFGSETLSAVRNFQTAMKIGVDGIVGKDTWTKLLKG